MNAIISNNKHASYQLSNFLNFFNSIQNDKPILMNQKRHQNVYFERKMWNVSTKKDLNPIVERGSDVWTLFIVITWMCSTVWERAVADGTLTFSTLDTWLPSSSCSCRGYKCWDWNRKTLHPVATMARRVVANSTNQC